MADDDHDREVHQRVVEVERAAEADVGVALAEPEQHPGDEEERREGGGDDRVDLLAGVEAPLRASRAAGEEAAVVAVEEVDLADRARARRGGCRAATIRTIAPAHETAV